jgi:hypothetical protein
VSTEPIPAAIPVAATRRREWLARGAFEAALILLGLLGAFALNEWQDARARETRVAALLTAIRAELEANLRLEEDAAAYNTEVAESIWRQANTGVTFIPDGTFKRGIFVNPQLTSAAWTTAQNDAALSDVPVDTLLLLATVYDQQADYEAATSALMNNMYATLLQADSTVLRLDGLGDPLRMGGVLRDNAGRGRQLVETYRTTLLTLGATPD